MVKKDLQDVEFDMQWSFTSIIPFISSICPSDTYKIYKSGNNVRIDTTLVGFEKLSWVRGNISFIFNGNDKRFCICDHDTKTVQQIWPKDFSIDETGIEEDISVALNTPIHASPSFNLDSFVATRAKSGFYGFRVILISFSMIKLKWLKDIPLLFGILIHSMLHSWRDMNI
jgi:hypothetical protein